MISFYLIQSHSVILAVRVSTCEFRRYTIQPKTAPKSFVQRQGHRVG